MKSSRVLTWVSAVLFGAALSVGAVGVASAHAMFVSSTPAPGSTSASAPASVAITFDDDLDKTATKITVVGPNNATVSGATTVSSANTKLATTSLTGAGNGVYTVNWHSVADDDKGVVEGSFAFGVGIPASALPKTGGETPGSWPLATLLAAAGAAMLGASLVLRNRGRTV